MPLLLLLFIILPLTEIALFIKVGGFIGLLPTLAIIVATAVLGTWLLRRQGAMAMRDVQRAFVELRDPSAPLAHGGLILISGMLLISPGFLTDTLGFLLLIPAVRAMVVRAMGKRMRAARAGFGAGAGFPGGFPDGPPVHRYNRGAVIDADYVDETPDVPPPSGDPAPGPRRPSGWTKGPGTH